MDYTHGWPTLLDTIQMFGQDGDLVPCAELLTKENPWLDYLPWIEASDRNVHKYNAMTGLPAAYIKKVNKGILPSVGTEASLLDPLAVLTSLSQVDDENLRQAPDMKAARWRLDKKHAITMGNDHGHYMVYGDPGNGSGEVMGFMQRINDPTAGNADNLLTFGGVGTDNTSILLLGVSEDTIACPYAKGSTGGLEITDLGRQLVSTSAPNAAGVTEQMVVWTTQFNLRHGLAVMDHRYLVRGCNLSVGDLRFQSGGQALDAPTHMFRVMSRMIDRIPASGAGVQLFFLAGKTASSYMRVHAMDKTVNVLGIENGLNQFGMPRSMPTFQGIPVLRCDALNTDEALVAGVTL